MCSGSSHRTLNCRWGTRFRPRPCKDNGDESLLWLPPSDLTFLGFFSQSSCESQGISEPRIVLKYTADWPYWISEVYLINPEPNVTQAMQKDTSTDDERFYSNMACLFALSLLISWAICRTWNRFNKGRCGITNVFLWMCRVRWSKLLNAELTELVAVLIN